MTDTNDRPAGSTIEMDRTTQCFYAGAAAAAKVSDAFETSLAGPYDERKIALWWFYVGSVAVEEYQITTNAEQEPFLLGANTRAPHLPTDNDEADATTLLEVVKQFYPTAIEVRVVTEEWDNGYFWTDTPTVVLPESVTLAWGESGDSDKPDFHSDVAADISHLMADLTHAMGPLGRHSEMTITVADGAIDDNV
jgi:hypothetical protein